MSELWSLPASELARLVRTRKVSAREVADSALQWLDSVNPHPKRTWPDHIIMSPMCQEQTFASHRLSRLLTYCKLSFGGFALSFLPYASAFNDMLRSGKRQHVR